MPDQPSYEGIVVLGSPRSGTTLVRRLLDAHPAIHCPPETNLLNGAARLLREDAFADGLSVGVLSGLAFSGVPEDTVIERLRAFVFGFFRDIAAQSGKRRWAEKTAFDAFYVDEVERLCGGTCRFVCVHRHPLDVVCSIKELADKMQMYLPELHEYVRRYPSPLDAFAHAWVDVNERLVRLEDAHPGECFRLRYEDLTTDPNAVLTALAAFLEEPVDVDAWMHAAEHARGDVGLGDWKTYETDGISRSSTARHARQLSPHTSAHLAGIVGPTMSRLGYAPIEAAAPVDAEAARHRYRMGRMIAAMKSAAGSGGGGHA